MSQHKPPARITIADVARRAGVSIATVSRVINQTARVAPDTQALVQAAIAELNYRPHAAARMLAGRKTNTLGLLLPEIGAAFFPPMLRGVEAEARESGFGLLIYATHSASAYDVAQPYPLGEHNTDGLLIFTNSIPEAELRRLHHMRFPVVLFYRSAPEGLDIPSVAVENKSGARQLVEHLVRAHDYRRIAFLRGPGGNEDSYWREQGYREALQVHGLPFDPALVAVGGFDRQAAQDAVDQWLREGLEFDAIFAGDDDAAIGALTALQRAGKRVPEDVALVGFDDTCVSRYLAPPLTTINAHVEQAGREAIRQLVRLIRTGQAEPLVLLPTELVIRRSCGCT
jgi:DNA-binding LacI/PurR family transcriptional regulator